MVPTNTKPITNWPDRDDAFHDVTMQISQVVSELHAKRAQVEADEPALTRMQQTSGQKTSPTAQNPLVSSVQVPPIPSLLSMGGQQSFATLLHILTTKPQAIELLHTFEGHKKTVLSVALTADGLVLASGSNDTTIKLWNTQTGQLLRTLKGHKATVDSVALSADGLILASGSSDVVKLWNAQTGQFLRTFEVRASSVKSVSLRVVLQKSERNAGGVKSHVPVQLR